MESVYLVVGSTGEYSDHVAWYVRAFQSQSAAQNLAQKLTVASTNLKGDRYSRRVEAANEELMRAQGDPQWQTDYTGTRYEVAEVPFDGRDS